jgi:hypothetical protein
MSDDNTRDGATPSLASAGSVANGQANLDGWIPATERLPEEGERVLAWDKDFNESEVATYYAHDGWGCDASISLNVTHWMPLPAPPTDGK